MAYLIYLLKVHVPCFSPTLQPHPTDLPLLQILPIGFLVPLLCKVVKTVVYQNRLPIFENR